jgi:hypothetical protein
VIVLPEAFERFTVDREGPAGSAWLSALPATVRELAERWDCTPDGEPLHGGVGIVVPVLRKTTEPAVLKVSFPHPENRFEPDALSAWDGRGAVLLHERDDDRYAMLLERAHPTTLAQAAEGDEVAAIAGSVSRRLAVPAPAGLPRLQDRAAGWEEQLRRDVRDFPDALASRTVQAATATVREFAYHQPDTLSTPAGFRVLSWFWCGSGCVGRWLGGVCANGTSSVHGCGDRGVVRGRAGELPGAVGFLPR